MTTKEPPDPTRPAPVPCVRFGVARPPAEHLACCYCHGDAAAVRSGDPAAFCSYQPGRDAISFGFPASGARLVHG